MTNAFGAFYSPNAPGLTPLTVETFKARVFASSLSFAYYV
jgi:hypothetical protein